jgi:hypothetical protein
LRHLVRDPGVLHGLANLALADRLDGDNCPALDVCHRGDAGSRCGALDMHGAGATLGDAAAELGTCQAAVADRPEKRHLRLDVE